MYYSAKQKDVYVYDKTYVFFKNKETSHLLWSLYGFVSFISEQTYMKLLKLKNLVMMRMKYFCVPLVTVYEP